MEIIHALSKLKIETTHSSSQEEKNKRNWLELPPDVLNLIFMKLSTTDILVGAQWVCSSWWKLSKQPHLFRSIHVEKVSTIFGCSLIDARNSTAKSSEGLAREAINRSCGQLVEFSIRAIPIDELLQYMSLKTSSLRSLRLVNVKLLNVYDDLIEIAKKLPHLEELGIIRCSDISKEVIETFGSFCPQLKSCRLNFVSSCWTEIFIMPIAIAENMPELRHLNLLGNPLTDDNLRAILDGCPHLEYLDLRLCYGLKFGGDLKERCKNRKVLRLHYSTLDFEYDSDDEYKSYYDSNSDNEIDIYDHYADDYEGYAQSSKYRNRGKYQAPNNRRFRRKY